MATEVRATGSLAAQELQRLLNFAEADNYSAELANDARKQVTIHLDVNQTIVFGDSITNKGPRDILNGAFAKNVVHCWPMNGTQESKPMSYFDFVYKHAVPGNVSDDTLKLARDVLINNFEHFVRANDFDFADQFKRVFTLGLDKLSHMETQGRSVLSAFDVMVEELNQEEVTHSIVIRTFGQDGAATKEEIEKHTPVRFQGNVDLREASWYTRKADGSLYLHPDKLAELRSIFKNPTLVRDSHDRWKNGGQTALFGKPVPIVDNETETTIAFDDNAGRVDQLKTCIAPKHPTTGDDLDIVVLMASGHVVRADAIEALFDVGYFSNRVINLLNQSPIDLS